MITLAFFVITAFAAIEVNSAPTCPSRDGQDSVYFPDDDCTKFWQCSNGTPYLFDCPANLHFNPKLNVCDWPDQAGCDGSASSGSSGEDSSSSSSGESDGDISGDTESGENGSGENGSGGDGSGEGDSSSSSGSSESGNSSGSGSGSGEGDDTSGNGSGSEEGDNTSGNGTGSSESGNSSGSGSGSGEGPDGCPAVDGKDSVYLPDEDCTVFWQCSNGVPILQKCPEGLHFNPTLNVCDWPDQAGCDGSGSSGSSGEGSSSSSSSESGDGDDSGDNNSGDNDSDDKGSGGDNSGEGDSNSSSSSGSSESGNSSGSGSGSGEGPDGCPAVDGKDSVYLPDEDCTVFWQCSNGVPILQKCPEGLHFNPTLNVCDWPDQAGCNGSAGSSEDDSNSS
ncbi:hypothetical protein MTP99_012088 [Tenebrio molitor]|nr:hypothetical protein MTP99_012088 [Tenebrio molitor]